MNARIAVARRPVSLLVLLALTGCAPVLTAEDGTIVDGPPDTTSDEERERESLPAGFGTLRQDQFTVPLRVGALLIKVTPLDESVIRLAAPDTYRRLHMISQSKEVEARQAVFGDEPHLVLVSFFSYEPDVSYQPEDLVLLHQGQVLRPRIVLPVTSGWGRERLQQRETRSAVYVYDQDIDYDLPVIVRYEMEQSNQWRDVIPVLERERAAVRSRAG